jgi:hypothetical protein
MYYCQRQAPERSMTEISAAAKRLMALYRESISPATRVTWPIPNRVGY